MRGGSLLTFNTQVLPFGGEMVAEQVAQDPSYRPVSRCFMPSGVLELACAGLGKPTAQFSGFLKFSWLLNTAAKKIK